MMHGLATLTVTVQ